MKAFLRLLSKAPPGTKRDVLISLLAIVASAALALVIPVGMGLLFGWVIPQADFLSFYWILTGIFFAGCARALLEWSSRRLWLRLGERIGLAWGRKIWVNAIALLLNPLTKQSAGIALAFDSVVKRIEELAPSLLLAITTALGSMCLMLLIHPLMAMAGFLYAGTALFLLCGLHRKRDEALKKLHRLAEKLQEEGLVWMRGAEGLRIAGATSRLERRLASLVEARLKTEKCLAQVDLLRTSLFAGALAFPCLLLFTASDLTDLDIGAFLAYLTAFIMLMNSLRIMVNFWPVIRELHVEERRVRPLFLKSPVSLGGTPLQARAGSLEIERVTFRYTRSSPAVLSNFSLSIKAGETVLITGPMGCGKSTLLRLITGQYCLETGSIYWGGEKLQTPDKQHVQAGIGVVWQRGEWSPGSLMGNIAGGSELPEEDVWRAAEFAGIAEEIRRLPMQMRTWVAEGAANFSEGQRLRLQIAKTLAHRPHTFLMDASFYTLAPKERTHLLSSLKKLSMISLLVSHQEVNLPGIDRMIRMPLLKQTYRLS